MLVGVMSESKLVSVECVNGSIECQQKEREGETEGGRDREKQKNRERSCHSRGMKPYSHNTIKMLTLEYSSKTKRR